jgi:uncharacterized protein (TIGR02246 family)
MTRNPDDTLIRALVDDWSTAVRAKDMDAVLARHADDIVMFDVPLPLQSRGMAEYRKTWELFFDNSPGGAGAFDVTELHITASETVAYCYGLVQIFDATVRLTMGLRKVDGQWLIAHEHHSYPIDLK